MSSKNFFTGAFAGIIAGIYISQNYEVSTRQTVALELSTMVNNAKCRLLISNLL